MSGKTISTSETKIEALKLQSSAYGVTIPKPYGVTRIAGNLLDYLNFQAVPHTTSQGGKGGTTVESTTYTYTADVIMGLAQGPISEVPRIWRGKKLYIGGWPAAQIVSATETYAVPGSGAMAYTVSHAATLLVVNAVYWLSGGHQALLANGIHYTASASGVVTILDEAQRGRTLYIEYQYGSGTQPQTAMAKLGLTFKRGTVGQAPWSALPSGRDVPYSALALVAGQAYDLGSGAQVENHMFEVVGPLAYHLGETVPDVDPALMLRSLLTDLQGGAGFPADRLADWSAWSDYCVAAGLLVSPALDQQVSAADVIRTAARLTNAAPVWTGGQLKMVPYADGAESGNGRTFTPDLTPAYDLDDECYVPQPDSPPVRCALKSPAERKNHHRVECLERDQGYSPSIAEAKDTADIDANGLRTADTLQAHWICSTLIGRKVVQIELQRSLAVCAEYTFVLPEHYALLEPADLVTLTDATLQLQRDGARITVIEEGADGELTITAEEVPAATMSAATYATQTGGGWQHDYNAAPGNVDTPIIFEGPAELSATGIEVYAAIRGSGSNWGGCQVWSSLDGTNYRQVGTVYGGARYGALSASASAGASSIGVSGLGSAQLISGSATDAAVLQTLCYVGGTHPEYLAYQDATLTGAGAYTLSGLVHAAYGTPANAHASGDVFVRIDERIVRSGDIDPSYIGKTIYFKFTSFNLYGGAQQSLADVSAYTHTVTGAMALLRPPGATQSFRQESTPSNPRIGSLWLKPSTGVQKRWNGTSWDPVSLNAPIATFPPIYMSGSAIAPANATAYLKLYADGSAEYLNGSIVSAFRWYIGESPSTTFYASVHMLNGAPAPSSGSVDTAVSLASDQTWTWSLTTNVGVYLTGSITILDDSGVLLGGGYFDGHLSRSSSA